MATDLLEVRDLCVRFGAHDAVRGLDFNLAAGETLALVGESGSGKSATALSLMQLLPASATLSGSIRLAGRELVGMAPRVMRGLRGREMSMIFQEPMTSLNPVLPVGVQITEALREHESMSSASARQRAVELLDLVRIREPQRRVHSFPHELSGGQRQRVMIAIAVACRPRLLIADEPTTALDATIQARILDLLDTLRRELSMALLLVTHDLGLVAGHADRVIVMLDGEKVDSGDTRSLFAAPAHLYTRALLDASLGLDEDMHYRSASLPELRREADADGARKIMVVPRRARAIAAHAMPPAEAPVAAPLLEVRDLHVHYAERGAAAALHAVDGVSLTIRRGETVGLVGESGCGKSSLSRAIMRLVPATSGQILLDGQDITSARERALRPLRRRVQMVFQDPYASLNPRRTVGDILDTTLAVNGMAARALRARRIATMLDQVGLPQTAAGRFPHEFSGGQRQRIGIARALIVEPELVVCDEPVSALDVSIQAQILNLLVALREELALSYLFISHDLSVVRYVTDRVHVMQRGRIVETGGYPNLWREPSHPYTKALLDAVPGRHNVMAAQASSPASATIPTVSTRRVDDTVRNFQEAEHVAQHQG
ncbi:ABC transporter ATP-binding protein [Chitinasiproducens palmae]|uniref:Peptide/nickel transport system ATP-binding protein n=1 Tax=Chitinasiproducens palmae TaxID=1770053 RepID=A0A1H2PL81_9BURK|nr:ABC transporter ATP-binding protein [Chitinasiproducens palmae]SDV47158.1 peptide/nickel transport system ATP-binding protein [Chitinasiproducens palmae]